MKIENASEEASHISRVTTVARGPATDPVEIALDLASIAIKNGGTTTMAERTFNSILGRFEKDRIFAAWRLDFIAASSVSGEQPLTVLRSLGPIGINLARASEAAVLGERVAKGEVDAQGIIAEVERIKALPPPYGRWWLVAAAACCGATFSQIPGGDWGALVIAFVAAGIGQFFRSMLQARQFAVAPVTLVCGVLSACLAAAGLRLGWSHTAAATLIASVVYMVPGLALINGFIDVVSHKHLLVGLERIANAAFLFLALAIAIAFAYTVIL